MTADTTVPASAAGLPRDFRSPRDALSRELRAHCARTMTGSAASSSLEHFLLEGNDLRLRQQCFQLSRGRGPGGCCAGEDMCNGWSVELGQVYCDCIDGVPCTVLQENLLASARNWRPGPSHLRHLHCRSCHAPEQALVTQLHAGWWAFEHPTEQPGAQNCSIMSAYHSQLGGTGLASLSSCMCQRMD